MAGQMPTPAMDTRIDLETRPPRMFAVIFHNDDYTTMDFVVHILTAVFRKSPQEAASLMIAVHEQGRAVVGTYAYDVAVSRTERAEQEAANLGFPLRITVEPET